MKTIDADGHVIEPADLWERELPAPWRGRGFAVRWNADSRQEEVHLDGRPLLPFGIVGVGMAGRPFDDIGKGVRYGELMPGGFDPRRRLVDMDSEGNIWMALFSAACRASESGIRRPRSSRSFTRRPRAGACGARA